MRNIVNMYMFTMICLNLLILINGVNKVNWMIFYILEKARVESSYVWLIYLEMLRVYWLHVSDYIRHEYFHIVRGGLDSFTE